MPMNLNTFWLKKIEELGFSLRIGHNPKTKNWHTLAYMWVLKSVGTGMGSRGLVVGGEPVEAISVSAIG